MIINKTQIAKDGGVSRGSLYYQSKQKSKDEKLKNLILETWKDSTYAAYGHKRLSPHLQLGKKKVLRVMRLYKLKPPKRRAQRPFKPEDLNNPEVKFPNLLWNTATKEFIELTQPNQAWSQDFTYIWFTNKFYYVATVLDVYTKELLGFAISDTHDTRLILEALKHALASTKRKPGILHSDQGSEYTSEEFQGFVLAQNIKLSYSRKASPWQNAFQESYYNNFKLDLGNMDQFEVVEELVVGVSHTIYLYNTKRLHTAIKNTPRQFYENHQLNLLKTAVS